MTSIDSLDNLVLSRFSHFDFWMITSKGNPLNIDNLYKST